MDQKKQLIVGVVAPEITLPDTSGKTVALRDIESDKTLVIFYSTTCPHCQTMIPQLSALTREKGPSLAVLAVSLDTNPNDWLSYVRTNKLTLVNVIDLQGWNGKSATDYFIYATPTMVLLDKEKKIIAKPMTVVELQRLL
jgi:thiol-disulfide isomerase/thioredoxin